MNGISNEIQHIDQAKVRFYAKLFIKEVMSGCGKDPSKMDSFQSVWKSWDEYYKEERIAEARASFSKGFPYGEKVHSLMKDCNLIHYHQVNAFGSALKGERSKELENALGLLYDRGDDQSAFGALLTILGGRFDTLSFLFFLKDSENYLPLRPRIFDTLFRKLGILSRLEGNCSWEKYQEYLGWMKEVQHILNTSVGLKFTLLDTHSFVWILPQLECGFFSPLAEEVLVESSSGPAEAEEVSEGAVKQITVNACERNGKAVRICKQHYLNKYKKLTCQICGFDFGAFYGEEYNNMIHIHHVVPLSKQKGNHKLNPKTDLLPVCPNCHLVLHANDGISVEDLKKRLAENNHSASKPSN